MSLRQRVNKGLEGTPPIHRLVATAFHPSHRGHRAAAIGRTVKYELRTSLMGRPSVIPLGDQSKIVAYKGETNSPHAVVRNPPNWPDMLVWKRELVPGDLFVDVGANIGVYSVYALELGAEVIAVEPVPHNAARVRENAALNGYTLDVVERVLTDAPGIARMTTQYDSMNHIAGEGEDGIDVAATTLDELLGERVVAGMKIDVEGAEELVLRGGARALGEQRIRLLQLEWEVSPWMGIDSREALQRLLEDAGYGLYIAGRDGRLSPAGDRLGTTLNVFAKPV
jgi:FkbM family methyltransferase